MITDTPAWQEHWQMRKLQGYPCTKRSKGIALNQLRRLDKDGYDPTLLLERSTDSLWRSFHRHPSCIKSRPIPIAIRPHMLAESDLEKGRDAMKGILDLVSDKNI